MDQHFHISDPSDWLGTPLAGFATLENLLHCQICKEFYDTPMLTTCAHTFCSKCIRTSLSADGKCPLCTKPDQASKLRNNFAVQEIVASFCEAREKALAVAQRAKEDEESERNGSGRRPGKRKRDALADAEAVGEREEQEGEGTRRTTRSKARKIAASQTSETPTEPIAVDDSDADSSFKPEKAADDGLVECPLGCGRRMKIEAVEPHLDKCEDEKKQKRSAQQRASRPGHVIAAARTGDPAEQAPRPQDRINELHYSGMKDLALSKKLKEIGIPNWGSKQLMVNRHREWVNIWNANCDSNRPRSKRDLLHDLDGWERTQGGRAPVAGGLSHGPMRKDFDGEAHSRTYKDEFSRLAADARRKRASPASTAAEGKDASRDGSAQEMTVNGGEIDTLKPAASPPPAASEDLPTASETSLAISAKTNALPPADTQSGRPELHSSNYFTSSSIPDETSSALRTSESSESSHVPTSTGPSSSLSPARKLPMFASAEPRLPVVEHHIVGLDERG